MCATILRDHGAEYARWAAGVDEGTAPLEILRAALSLPPPFRDFSEVVRRRLCEGVDRAMILLLRRERDLSDERRRARKADSQAVSARRDAAELEAALRAAEKAAEAEAAALGGRIGELHQQLAERAAECDDLRRRVADLEERLAARPNVSVPVLRLCLRAVVGGAIDRKVRRTARNLLSTIQG